MKILITPCTDNPVSLLRRAGYTFQRQEKGEMSFIRPLARAGFPRFHCYTTTTPGGLSINMHLDQKKETYGNDTRHHGEYENDGALKTEVEHLLRTFGSDAKIVS